MANDTGHKIAILRQQYGYSQIDLGAAAEISTTTIARIETGKTDPRLSTLEKLALALNKRLIVQFE